MKTSNQTAQISPAPWSYDYSPWRLQDGRDLPAFEIFDAEGDIRLDGCIKDVADEEIRLGPPVR
ncbi:hypothetical protein [Anatilimnocola floriformis]|uniref:hypothetical protein n=1 Tax=Anatilimnocola floriformis TaxID=2948575 RepID=UPI0020C24BEA|nr:hypothetical protein [Anatilimnocola floriformis]